MKKQIYRYFGPLFLLALVGIVMAWAQGKMGPNFGTIGSGSGPSVDVPKGHKTTGQVTTQNGSQQVQKQGTSTANALLAATDTDGDGVPDATDLDNDNDGIPDTVEDTFTGGQQSQLVSKVGVTASMDLSAQTGNITQLLDGLENIGMVYLPSQTIAGRIVAEFAFPAPTVLTSMEFNINGSYSFLTASSVVNMQGWTGSAWVTIVPSFTPGDLVVGQASIFSSYGPNNGRVLKFPMPANTTAYTRYRVFGVSGTTTSVSPPTVTEVYLIGPCTDACTIPQTWLVPKTGVTASVTGLTGSGYGGSSAYLVDNSDNTTYYFSPSQAIAAASIAEFTFVVPTVVTGMEFAIAGPYSFLTAGSVVKMQGWNGSAWVDIVSSYTPLAPTSSPYLAYYSVKFPMPANTTAYTKYRVFGVSGTTTSLPQPGYTVNIQITDVYFTGPGFTGVGIFNSDLDGDGLVNSRDLDSDGDGCPDALEGGASFVNANLVNSSLAGGNSGTGYTGSSTSPVTKNLGNTVGSTGIPTIAGTGQALGTSQNGGIQGANCQTLGALDCSKAQITGIVAGTAGSGMLKLSINVIVPGPLPVTVSGSGLLVVPSPYTISASAAGTQTFYVPLSYSGAAFAAGTTITINGAGTCTVDMTAVTPRTVITSILDLGSACTPTAPATLSK